MKKLISLVLSLAVLIGSFYGTAPDLYAATTQADRELYDVAILSDGQIAVLYRENVLIMLGIYQPTTNQFKKQAIDLGKNAAMCIDDQDLIHLAIITPEDNLAYITYNGSLVGSPILIDSLAFGGVDGPLSFPDIAVDDMGYVHLAYLDARGGYSSGNDYSSYDKADLIYANNSTGTFVRQVRSYSHGWLYSPDGWRNLVNTPVKIEVTQNSYGIGHWAYSLNKWMGGQDHTYSYAIALDSSLSPDSLSYTINSSSTNSAKGFKFFEMVTDGSAFYSLSTKNSLLQIFNGISPIGGTSLGFNGQYADLTIKGSNLYYMARTNASVSLYQNGLFKEDLSLTETPSTSQLSIHTVVDSAYQYGIYLNTNHSLCIIKNNLDQNDLTLQTYVIPDKTQVSLSGLVANDKVYDGQPITLEGSLVALDPISGETVSLTTYDLVWMDLSSNVIEQPIQVGSYQVKVQVPETHSDYFGSFTQTFTISPKTITADGIEAINRPYDGSLQVTLMGGTLNGLITGDTVSIGSLPKGLISSKDVGLNKSVSLASSLSIEGPDAHNYTLASYTNSISVDITKAPLQVTGLIHNPLVYNGSLDIDSLKATFSGVMAGESVQVTDYLCIGYLEAKHAGNNVIHASLELTDTPNINNYYLLNSEISQNVVVEKAIGLIGQNPTIQVIVDQSFEYQYDLNQIVFNKEDLGSTTFSLGTLVGEDQFEVIPTLGADGHVLSWRTGNSFSNQASLSVKVVSDNYEDILVTLTFEGVTKQLVTLSGLICSDKIYDGFPYELQGNLVAIAQGDDSPLSISTYTYEWKDLTSDQVLDNPPQNAGSYQVRISVSENNQHYTGEVSYSFSILPKDVSVSFLTAEPKVYDGKTDIQLNTGDLEGLLTSDDVTLVAPRSGHVASSNVGLDKLVHIVPFELTGPDKSNYNLIQPTSPKVAISSKKITILSASGLSRSFNGSTSIEISACTFDGLIEPDQLTPLVDYEANGLLGNPDVGLDKPVDVTIQLLSSDISQNYYLASNHTSVLVDITKSNGLTCLTSPTLEIRSNLAKRYEYNLSQLTYNVTDYGLMDYEILAISGDTLSDGLPYILNGQLILDALSTVSGSGTISLQVNATNYESIQFEIGLLVVTPPAPSPTPTPSPSPSPSTAPQVPEVLDLPEEEVLPEAIVLDFTDIQGHWAYDYVATVYGQGLISGYPDGSFRPNATMSRAEFVTILVKMIGLEDGESTNFVDIENHWAKKSIEIAFHHGLIKGISSTNFAPDAPLSREQMATIIYTAYKINQGSSHQVPDQADIADWALDAVLAILDAGYMTGYDDGSFKPKSNITRAEVVTVIARLILALA